MMFFFRTNTFNAIKIPSNAKKGSIIQYKNNKFNVLAGELVGNNTLDYEIKENDIITFAENTSILHVHSQYDNNESVSGYIFNFLYSEFPFKVKKENQYLFETKTDKEIVFVNYTTNGLLIYDLDIIQNEKHHEIITRHIYLDQKFNTTYNIGDGEINRTLIKTSSNLKTSIKTVNSKGVAYEPKK